MTDIAELVAKHASTVETKFDEQKVAIAALREHIAQVEQKGHRPTGGQHAPTLGDQLIKSEKFSQYRSNGYQGSARIELKAITSSDAAAWSGRDPEIESLTRRQFKVRDLLNVVPTLAGSVDYARQVTRTNAAAPVAEAAQKPTSSYAWEQVNLPMRTIAHLSKITRQALEDDVQLAAEVESEMRYGLQLEEDDQLLNGDGTGQNLTGLVPAATAFAAEFTLTAPNMIDVIGLAILQQSLTEYPTDGVVLHPTDWMKMRLLKDADGKYILGDPYAAIPPVIFDRPVALTQAQTEGDFLVGGFKRQKLYDRMSPEVLIASENATDFETNLYTMRCEERLGLAIRAPGALVTGDFAAAITAATAS